MLLRYSGKNKFIFVANRKCASTSIVNSKIAEVADIKLRKALIGRHTSIEEVYETFMFIFDREKFGFNKFFKFGVIRDPLSWVCSYYNDYSTRLACDKEMTFADFFNKKPHVATTQSAFLISNKYESVKVNYLIRYEHLLEDLSRICEILELETLDIPTLNQSNKRVLPHSIDKSFKQEIMQRYRDDYDLIENLDSFNARGLGLFQNNLS